MVPQVPLRSLWFPILVSAALLFVASSISHGVLRFHRWDFRGLSAEGDVIDVLRKAAVPPGDYLFPFPASVEGMKDAGFQEKWKRGPIGFLTVLPGGTHPGRTFTLWFLYCVAVEVFVAFLAARSLPSGAIGGAVFLLTAVAAFGFFVLAHFQSSIWYGRDVATTLRFTVDGLAYGLLTGASFSWLWPK
jgi:hypothetical protein